MKGKHVMRCIIKEEWEDKARDLQDEWTTGVQDREPIREKMQNVRMMGYRGTRGMRKAQRGIVQGE